MFKFMQFISDNNSRYLAATTLLSYPSTFKEASRIVDLWGSLDEYAYSGSDEEADRESLKRDYCIIMKDLSRSQHEYEQNAKK